MKTNLTTYILAPVSILGFVFAMEYLTDAGLIPQLGYASLYAFRIIAILVTLGVLVACFSKFNKFPTIIVHTLSISALLILLDYYFNIGNADSENLLCFLPIIAIVYVAKYKIIVNNNKTSDNDK
jgi:hypothetical protein